MSASLTTHPSEIHPGMYFVWNDHLYYVLDTKDHGNQTLVENCMTLSVFWLKTSIFKNWMKEVNANNVGVGN